MLTILTAQLGDGNTQAVSEAALGDPAKVAEHVFADVGLSAMLGFGLPNDNIHAPNERYALECYEKGVEASIRFLGEL